MSKKKENNTNSWIVGAVIAAVIIIIGLIILSMSITKVPAGYVGVKYNMNGGVEGDVLDQGWLNFVNILTTRVAHAEDCFSIVFQMVHIRSTATRVVCFASIEDVAVAQYTILAILDFPFSFHFFLLSMIFVSI